MSLHIACQKSKIRDDKREVERAQRRQHGRWRKDISRDETLKNKCVEEIRVGCRQGQAEEERGTEVAKRDHGVELVDKPHHPPNSRLD